MLERLVAFEAGNLSAHSLVNDLEGLLSALENADKSWRQAFLQSWGGMEDVRAVAIDRGGKLLSRKDTQEFHDLAREIKALVPQKVDADRGEADEYKS